MPTEPDEAVEERLPCGHTEAEHEALRAGVQIAARWLRTVFFMGFILGGIIGIVAMLVFQ